jgi:hypothetical protein
MTNESRDTDETPGAGVNPPDEPLRFSRDPEDYTDSNGEGDPEATREAARILEHRRNDMSSQERTAEWKAKMRAQRRTINEHRQEAIEAYPSRPYSESVFEKADDVPAVDAKQSADWLAEARAEREDTNR